MNGQLASIAGRPVERGQGGSSNHVAAFLHEVVGVGEHQRRRRPARVLGGPAIAPLQTRRPQWTGCETKAAAGSAVFFAVVPATMR